MLFQNHDTCMCVCLCNFSFSPEEKAGRDPLTHIPFGWGPRQCIGKRFAMMEMKMAVTNCFRRYKFVRAPETQVRATLFITCQLCDMHICSTLRAVVCTLYNSSPFRSPSKELLPSQLGLLMESFSRLFVETS